MPEPISTPNPVAQPDVPAKQPSATTPPNDGFTSQDPGVQAKIKAMQESAVAQSSQASKPPAPITAGMGGEAPKASASSVPVTATNAQQEPPKPQIGPSFTERQSEQLRQAAMLQTGKSNPADLTQQEIQEAARRASNVAAFETGKVVKPAQGLVFDPSTGRWKDPVSQAFYAGMNPKGGLLFTTDEAAAMDTVFADESVGVLTTDAPQAAVNVMGNVLERAKSSPLPHSGTVTGQGKVLDPKTGLEITSSSDEYQAMFGSEAGRLLNDIKMYQELILSDASLETKAIANQQLALSQRKAEFVEDIHKRALAEYDGQIEANKQAKARAEVFFANRGMVGSSQELQFVGDTIRKGEAALRGIADSERRAINEAEFNFSQQDYQLAREKLQVAKQARESYMNLFFKQQELRQTFEQMAMQRQEFSLNMRNAAVDEETKRLEQEAVRYDLQGKRSEAAQRKVQNLIQGGFDLTADTAPEFMELAKEANWTPQMLTSYVKLTKDAINAQKEKEAGARYEKELTNAKNLVDILDKTGAGGKIRIGDFEYQYQGQMAPDVFQGTETDQFGNVIHWTVDKKTGVKNVTSLGAIGKPQDGWTQVQTDQGFYFYNTKTGAYRPAEASIATSTVQAIFPDGSKENPFRPEKGASGVQCGELQNDCNDPGVGRVWGDSLPQKLAAAKKYAVPLNEASVGDTIVQGGSETGHVFRILDEKTTPDGKRLWLAFEANMLPPGGGAVTSTRWVEASDPKNKAAARVPTRPGLIGGTDSLVSSAIMGGASVPTIGGKPLTEALPSEKQSKASSWTQAVRSGAKSMDDVPVDVLPDVQVALAKASKAEEAEAKSRFASRLQDGLGMSLTPEKLEEEWAAYKAQSEQAGNLTDPKEIAKGIFDGTRIVDVNGLPAKDKARVDAELGKLKTEALRSGDVVGQLRASAGGKDVTDTFITSYEKSANVLAQIDELSSNIIGSKSVGPIVGIISSNNPYDTKSRLIQTQLTSIVPNLARGVYGEVGVLTDADVRLYSKTLPNLRDTEATNKAILSATVLSVARSMERKLLAQAAARRDVSGYVQQYVDMRDRAYSLLSESAPDQFRVYEGNLYRKADKAWEMVK